MSLSKIKGGVAHDGKGKQFTTFRDALAHDAKCGCGLDCKNGFLVLPDFNPDSGDVQGYSAIFIVDGALTVMPVAEAKALIKSFCQNSLVSVTNVEISGCPQDSIDIEDTVQLTAIVTPSNSLQTGTWASTNTSVATVDNTGLVSAEGEGSTTITFTTTDGGFVAYCSITVTD